MKIQVKNLSKLEAAKVTSFNQLFCFQLIALKHLFDLIYLL